MRPGACSQILVYMADLQLTSNIDLTVYPSEYLLDDFTNNQCRSLISTNDQGSNDLYGLGEPFFRSYNIKLNYWTTEITIYTPGKTDYSPETNNW